MAFTWKVFRARFLQQFLWIAVTRDEKKKDLGPPSTCMSTTILSNAIIDLEGKEQYQGLMSEAAQCYKNANSQALAPLDVSSFLSALEELPVSSSEGEGGEATSSAIEESSSQRKPVQTTATVHNVDSSQVSSQTRQQDETVVEMETDEANVQKWGAAHGSDKESSAGNDARSENPDLQTKESVEFRGEVRGGQSIYGGVHSVVNETPLTSRAHSSSSSSTRTSRDSTLDRLSCAQFHDPWSRDSKASTSATRDVGSSQSIRATFLGDSRDASLNLSRGAGYRDFEVPSLTSSPRRLYQDFPRDAPSIGSRPVTPYADILKEVLRVVHMPDLLVQGLPPPSSPWALLPDNPQDNWSVALAPDDHILQELLDAFKAPEPRSKLVEQNSSFRIPQALYPKFFRAPPLGEQVLATSDVRGSVPGATIIDHRKVVEGLYEAFMATFRTNWHASILVRFFFEIAQDRMSRDVALYLYRALVEQRTICLKAASSSIGLIRRQAVETSTLGNWTPLRSRLAPIPFKGWPSL